MKQLILFLVLCIVHLLSPISLIAREVIERVEPPFWWTDFENTKLQLLVKGDHISDYQLSFDYEGVTLESVETVESPNYLFINLQINPLTKPGKIKFAFASDSHQEIIFSYELLQRKKNAKQIKGFDSSDTIYLITPDRFANGNPENDSVNGMKEEANRGDKDGRHGGDIQGISEHLDYIADMGFTSIWLNPMLENDQGRTSYHGYSTTDFYQIDRRFGSNEEFIALADKARSKGLGLIMDMIVNHSGSEHWWFHDVPSNDWINFGGKYSPTSHRHTTARDPYASDIDRKNFSDGWYWKTMPDLNQRNPMMANYLIQNAIWWIEYAGLSGIRMDTYRYPDMNFMALWSKRIMDEYPNFNIVGEDWSTNPIIVSYWQKGKQHKNGYESSLPSLMDFPLQDALVSALTEEESWSNGFAKLYEILVNDIAYPDPSNLVIFSDNHDTNRIFTLLGENRDLLRMAIVYTLTMRGIPQIFYGTELLMNNPTGKEDGIIRSDFPGGWENDSVDAFSGKGLTTEQKETQALLRKLLNWRKNKTVIHTGKLKHFVPENGVYVYFRYDETDKVMVILNKNINNVILNTLRFSEILPANAKGTEILTGKSIDFSDIVSLIPRQPLIIEID